jgi:DNA-binding MarR family transcriptional regulator
MKAKQQALLDALVRLGGERTAIELADASGTDRRAAGQRLWSLYRQGLVTRYRRKGRTLAERVDVYRVTDDGRDRAQNGAALPVCPTCGRALS